MVANINSIAWTGEAPWHGLGTQVESHFDSETAIREGGLDWEVDCHGLYSRIEVADAEGNISEKEIECPNNYAVVRMDTLETLGVVGNRFKPVQNADCFKFFDAVCADGQARYEVVGALGKGEKIFALAKIIGDYRIAGTDDIIDPYMLLVNGHDGTQALEAFLTEVRAVCQNTIQMALRANKKRKAAHTAKSISLRHTGTIMDRVDAARIALGLAVEKTQEFVDLASLMAGKQLSSKELQGFFETVYPDNETSDKNTRAKGVRSDLEALFIQGEGNAMPGIRGSVWAAVNAVTQYADHHATVRSTERNSRMSYSLFGTGAKLKDRAWEAGLALVGVGNGPAAVEIELVAADLN